MITIVEEIALILVYCKGLIDNEKQTLTEHILK